MQHGGDCIHAAVAQHRHRAEFVARDATGSRHHAEVIADEVAFVRVAGQFVIALAQRVVTPRHAAAAHGVARAVARIERGRHRQGVGAAARAGHHVAVRIAVVVQRARAQCRHHADAGGGVRAAAVGLVAIAATVVALAQDVAAGRIAVGDRAAEDARGRGQALQGIVAVVLGIRVRCAARLTDRPGCRSCRSCSSRRPCSIRPSSACAPGPCCDNRCACRRCINTRLDPILLV